MLTDRPASIWYDLEPGDGPPAPGDYLYSVSRRSGLPNSWYEVIDVRPVERRTRTNPLERWSMRCIRRGHVAPADWQDHVCWPLYWYPRG